MKVPLNVVLQTKTLLERQLVEMQEIIGRLEKQPGTKSEAAKLLDVWQSLGQVRETLEGLYLGALADEAERGA